MIYVTGDLHRENDIDKMYKIAKLEKIPDIVLIAGDFGGIWDPVKNTENGVELGDHDKRFLKQLSELPFKIISCLGNHENYDAIDLLSRTDAYGGKTIKLTDNVEILDRGYVFTIEGKKIFSLGGAMSPDKQYRTEHSTWWSQETITEAEFQRSLAELAKVDFTVDAVLTHTAPSGILSSLMDFYIRNPASCAYYMQAFSHDESSRYLEKIRQALQFKHWYYGHFHEDIDFTCENRKFSCRYNSFTELEV